MQQFRLIALPLAGLALLFPASGENTQRAAAVRAAVAPINAVLERSPAKLCASFVPAVAEKLVPASGVGQTCEAAVASVFEATSSTDSQTTVIAYVQPIVEQLDVSGSHASITIRGSYQVRAGVGAKVAVYIEAFGPLRILLEERSGVWQVASTGRLATFCARAQCAEGSSEMLFTYGEPQPMSLKLLPTPAAVRHAGVAERRTFEEGMRVTAQSGCLACHRIGAAGNRGPGQNLTRVGAELTEPEIARALVDSRKPMPSFSKLSPAKLRAVVRFLSLLR
jgi:hypothetical protein